MDSDPKDDLELRSNPVDFSTMSLAVSPGTSGVEEIAKASLAGARVVKAFNITFAGTLLAGQVANQPLDVFIAGDDVEAKVTVAQLITSGGCVQSMSDRSSGPVYLRRSSSFLTRLAEVCFMQMLRLFATQTLESTSGWLRGLADPPIAAALQAIHADPLEPWTVERLASEAHLSRSSFAERFKTLVGETPLHYVQRWRMQRTAHLLDEGNQPLKTIIALSGYASEAAFRKAFHHWIGVLPSEYHKAYSQ